MEPGDIIIDNFTGTTFGGLSTNIFAVAIILGCFMFIAYMYMKWTREKNNPYFMNNMLMMHPYKVKVEYFRQIGNTFQEDGEETCCYGEKGVYFHRLAKIIPVASSIFIYGKTKKLKFCITDTGIGYPMKLTHDLPPTPPYTQEEIESGNYDKFKMEKYLREHEHYCHIAKGEDESYDLLLTQTIDALYDNVQKKADDDKTFQERMLEAAPQFLLLGSIVLCFLLCMYFVDGSISKANTTNAALMGSINQFYTSHIQQQVYCSTMIAKYGSDNEKSKWNEYVAEDIPPTIT